MAKPLPLSPAYRQFCKVDAASLFLGDESPVLETH